MSLPQVSHEGPSAKHIACGGDFSAFVGTDGSIWTWGHPEYGQLGHNTEGQYIEKAGKVNYDYVYNPTRISTFVEKDARKKNTQYLTPPTIVTMDCGTNHCVRNGQIFGTRLNPLKGTCPMSIYV